MENKSFAPCATRIEISQKWDLLKATLINLFTNRPKLIRRLSRSEAIEKFIEDLSFEITGRDFNSIEIARIINGLTEAGTVALQNREKYHFSELESTRSALDLIAKPRPLFTSDFGRGSKKQAEARLGRT